MEIKMTNADKISEESKAKFYEYMDEASNDFRKEANIYLDSLYSIKNVWTYRPSSTIIKLCTFVIYFCIMFEFATLMDAFIDFMVYNVNGLVQSLMSIILLAFQFVAVIYLLYNAMIRDIEYRHDCYIKFVNSDCVKRYENKLLTKASELNIELEVIRDDK